jgi:hypothetical protein
MPAALCGAWLARIAVRRSSVCWKRSSCGGGGGGGGVVECAYVCQCVYACVGCVYGCVNTQGSIACNASSMAHHLYTTAHCCCPPLPSPPFSHLSECCAAVQTNKVSHPHHEPSQSLHNGSCARVIVVHKWCEVADTQLQKMCRACIASYNGSGRESWLFVAIRRLDICKQGGFALRVWDGEDLRQCAVMLSHCHGGYTYMCVIITYNTRTQQMSVVVCDAPACTHRHPGLTYTTTSRRLHSHDGWTPTGVL